jgi:hypothetical protein
MRTIIIIIIHILALCSAIYTQTVEKRQSTQKKKQTNVQYYCTNMLCIELLFFFSIFFHILLFVVPLYNIPTSQYNIYTVYITTSKIQPTPDHVDTESLIQFAAGWI